MFNIEMKNIGMQKKNIFKHNYLSSYFEQRINLPRKKTGTFFVSNHNNGGNKMKMLHLLPDFERNPEKYNYEISGSDGFKLDGITSLINNNNPKIILSFNCKAGETYFCKIIAYYSKKIISQPQQKTQKTEYDTEEFRLFYKVNDDFDESIEEEVKVITDVMIDKENEEEEENENEEENEEDEEENEEDEEDEMERERLNKEIGEIRDMFSLGFDTDDDEKDFSKI